MTQPVLATHVLAPHLAGFCKRYPKIVLDITVESFKEPPIEDYDITLFPANSSYDGDVIARKSGHRAMGQPCRHAFTRRC